MNDLSESHATGRHHRAAAFTVCPVRRRPVAQAIMQWLVVAMLALKFAPAPTPAFEWPSDTPAAGDKARPPTSAESRKSAGKEAATEESAAETAPDLKPGEWELVVEPDDQLFPSLFIATATVAMPKEAHSKTDVNEFSLGDPDGLMGILINNPKENTKVKVTLATKHLFEPSTVEVTLPKKGEIYRIDPKIKWDYGALLKITQTTPVNITATVTLDDGAPQEKTRTVRARMINDCLFYYGDPEDGADFSWMFAAYVNEDHPFVDQILKEALDTGIVSQFDGYQSEDPLEVYRQVFAVWAALSRKGIRYSNITTTAADSGNDQVFSQHVRLLDDSVKAAQANCVDGSVLLASILRKIGIEPFLIQIPGHMFMGFYLDPEGETPEYLETTVMGEQNPDEVKAGHQLKKIADAKMRQAREWKTFLLALALGAQEFEEAADEFEAENPEYTLTNIMHAREAGIMPIGYDKDK